MEGTGQNMKSENIIDLTENWENLPFAYDWQETFNFINNQSNITEKEHILNKIANVVYLLITDGNTYESVVLNTAQVYLFVKHTKCNVNIFKDICSKFVLDGAKFLLENSNDFKTVYDSKEFPYLYKISIAEFIYLLENNEFVPNTISKIDLLISNYQLNSQKGLMNHLILARNKI